eukprot:gene2788-1773_t
MQLPIEHKSIRNTTQIQHPHLPTSPNHKRITFTNQKLENTKSHGHYCQNRETPKRTGAINPKMSDPASTSPIQQRSIPQRSVTITHNTHRAEIQSTIVTSSSKHPESFYSISIFNTLTTALNQNTPCTNHSRSHGHNTQRRLLRQRSCSYAIRKSQFITSPTARHPKQNTAPANASMQTTQHPDVHTHKLQNLLPNLKSSGTAASPTCAPNSTVISIKSKTTLKHQSTKNLAARKPKLHAKPSPEAKFKISSIQPPLSQSTNLGITRQNVNSSPNLSAPHNKPLENKTQNLKHHKATKIEHTKTPTTNLHNILTVSIPQQIAQRSLRSTICQYAHKTKNQQPPNVSSVAAAKPRNYTPKRQSKPKPEGGAICLKKATQNPKHHKVATIPQAQNAKLQNARKTKIQETRDPPSTQPTTSIMPQATTAEISARGSPRKCETQPAKLAQHSQQLASHTHPQTRKTSKSPQPKNPNLTTKLKSRNIELSKYQTQSNTKLANTKIQPKPSTKLNSKLIRNPADPNTSIQNPNSRDHLPTSPQRTAHKPPKIKPPIHTESS